MSIESYNFGEFVQRDDLMSYKNLFASEAPGLKGKPICQDLVEMDREEFSVVKSEETELKCIIDKDLNGYRGTAGNISLLGGIAAVVGFVGMVRAKVTVTYLATDVASFASLFFGLIVCSISGSVAGGSSEEEKFKITEIFDNRIARLVSKMRFLDQKIASCSDPSKTEEFHLAKDFFKSRYVIYLGIRTKPASVPTRPLIIHSTNPQI